MLFTKVAAVAASFGLAAAHPSHQKFHASKRAEAKRAASFSLKSAITTLTSGLFMEDAEHMAKIGMAYQGVNAAAQSDSTPIWLGTDGPNIFSFSNTAEVPVNVVMWYMAAGDYQSSFMNAEQPMITKSLDAGETFSASLANDISGGLSVLYNRVSTLTTDGQLNNTWAEFTTGEYATVDVSRLVNQIGNPLTATVTKGNDPGCVSDFEKCVFVCKDTNVNSCGAAGEVKLVNCEADSQPGANAYDADGDAPQGGCAGWSNGGTVEITIG
ncbi:hypothetical protein GGR56DRAFT_192849 [Xylariaceae sp. FL0804]|nr:hypothetical protein GGR56DRAFT_192849 [Xylariaceae sp. FL0804]